MQCVANVAECECEGIWNAATLLALMLKESARKAARATAAEATPERVAILDIRRSH